MDKDAKIVFIEKVVTEEEESSTEVWELIVATSTLAYDFEYDGAWTFNDPIIAAAPIYTNLPFSFLWTHSNAFFRIASMSTYYKYLVLVMNLFNAVISTQ